MGRKIRAAKASLVAAFVAAGGAAAAGAVPGKSTHLARHTATAAEFIKWGDPLIRFVKLDGFPSYLKLDGSEQLAMFSKDALLRDTAAMYFKYSPQVDDLLSLYHKANAGPLSGILIALETYWKGDQSLKTLVDSLNSAGLMDSYVKFWGALDAFQKVAPADGGASAFSFFVKETGIAGNPLQSRDVIGGQLG